MDEQLAATRPLGLLTTHLPQRQSRTLHAGIRRGQHCCDMTPAHLPIRQREEEEKQQSPVPAYKLFTLQRATSASDA